MASSAAGGLQLLLETYNDSDCQDEDHGGSTENVKAAGANSATKAQRKEKLPLPDDVKSMFSDKTDQTNSTNNNSLDQDHGGRIRSFAHVRGNWSSYVFLPFTLKNRSLNAMAEILQDTLEEFPDQPNVTINEEFHLSLSRTVVLHHHWIEPFIQSLKKAFRIRNRFDVIFTEFQVYLNEEKTRTFIGMNIFASETLFSIIRECDACLQEYGLEKYYQDPSFHVSVAWCVGNQEKWMKAQLLPLINSKWVTILDNDSSLQVSPVHSIDLKTGNKVYQFQLENL